MQFWDLYKKRVLNGASDSKEYALGEARNNFERMLKESISSIRVDVYSFKSSYPQSEYNTLVSVTDITSNDQKTIDEKFLLCRHDEDIEVGYYVKFDNTYWLVAMKEHKSVNDFKKFTIKKCNQFFRYKVKDIVYDIPIHVLNLTQYSDGLQDVTYTSMADAKVSVSMGCNEITKSIKLNTRMMLTNRTVFRITYINDFTMNSYTGDDGVISILGLQTTLIPEDDLENNIAFNSDVSNDNIEDNPNDNYEIVGDKDVIVGSTNTYKSTNPLNVKWSISEGNEYVLSNELGSDYIKLKFSGNSKYVGKVVKLQLLNSQTGYLFDEIEIKLRGFV